MAQKIVDEITPLTEQIRKVRQNNKPYGLLTETFLQKYMAGDVDKLFSIRYENAIPWIGNKVISILSNDDIVVNGKVYEGTPGLWSLITDKNPKEYTFDDLINYKEMLRVHCINIMMQIHGIHELAGQRNERIYSHLHGMSFRCRRNTKTSRTMTMTLKIVL